MNLTFKEAKKNFFDRKKVMDKVAKGRRGALAKIGGFIRTNSRRRIRKARRMKPAELSDAQRAAWEAAGKDRKLLPLKSSEPGQSPRERRGGLRSGILFAYDEKTKSVVSGPVRFNFQSEAPEDLEKGGESELTATEPIRTKKGRRATKEQLAAFRRKLRDGTLEKRPRSRKRRYRFRIKKRPYMAPALEAAKPKIPKEFRGIVK